MDFFENAASKTKEVFEVAKQRTDEVVTVQKMKFKIAKLEKERNYQLQKLGFAYYKMLKDTEIEDSEIKEMFDVVAEKNIEIKEIRKEISEIKNKLSCPHCGAHIDKDSIFCNICGKAINEAETGEDE